MKLSTLKWWRSFFFTCAYGLYAGLWCGVLATHVTNESTNDVSTSIKANRRNLSSVSMYDDLGFYTGYYNFIDQLSYHELINGYGSMVNYTPSWSTGVPVYVSGYSDLQFYSDIDYDLWCLTILVGAEPDIYIDGGSVEVVGFSGLYFLNLSLLTADFDSILSYFNYFSSSPFWVIYNDTYIYTNNRYLVTTDDSTTWANLDFNSSYLYWENQPDVVASQYIVCGSISALLYDCYALNFSYTLQYYYDLGYSAGIDAGYEGAYQLGYGAGFNQGAQGQVVAVSSAYNQGYGNGYVDGLSAGKPIGYDSGFDVGYDQGYSHGYSVGYSSGYGQGQGIYGTAYQAGYDYGYGVGKNVGYQQGLNAGTDETIAITNLFMSIASVPWTILNGLGTFTIWDISIMAIAVSFMVVGLVLWLVRKFI